MSAAIAQKPTAVVANGENLTRCVLYRETEISPTDALSISSIARRITLSSDANVSMPVLDCDDHPVGLHNAPPSILHRELVHVIRTNQLPLDQALPPKHREPRLSCVRSLTKRCEAPDSTPLLEGDVEVLSP